MAYSATDLQLTHVLQQFYRRTGGLTTLATGGSTSTIVDTKLATLLGNSNRDDYFNGGTAIVIEDAGGAAAAPEGEFTQITDYVASTTTATLSPSITAVASGDRVMLAPSDYPLYDVIEAVNDALRSLTEQPQFDTTITTAANQTEYTLPVAVKGGRILRVDVQGITTDANDNRWMTIPRSEWEEWYNDPGSTAVLKIPQFATGYTIRVTYQKWHARVDAFADYISEYLHPDLVHAAVMAHALQWRNDTDRATGVSANPEVVALEQKAWSQVDRARVLHPVIVPQADVRGFPHWSASRGVPKQDTFTTPDPA